MSYFVTRQRYVYCDVDEAPDAVEIAYGLDNISPDALAEAYPGEMEEFDDPREAAGAAVRLSEAWGRDLGHEVPITRSAASSMGLYPTPADGYSAEETLAWGEAEAEKLPKCDRCGAFGAEEWQTIYGDKYLACGEFCGRAYADDLVMVGEED